MSEAATLPTVEDALALGLTRAEYELICEKQGRAPNQVELAMYSLLWSEHCAYKHSKKLLRTLPTEGPNVVMGPGENAGAVDVGGGLVCAFKVESHNHPSAVEPFQGAATGVGGILRDIFAIGARPIAVLDSLRFGEPYLKTPHPPHAVGEDEGAVGEDEGREGEGARARYLLDRAVAGIGHYGNSIGVPTIGGELYFEGPYEQNCLVNAMALGIAEREHLVTSAAVGVGNTVLLFGASTGRDGIGGASVLASAELDLSDSPQNPPSRGDSSGKGPDGHNRRSTVQVGDPFEEKKLMECSLELLRRGLLVSLQDLGAAGLTSSASEMASKGEVGIDVDVAKVPLREEDMEPFEIMVSESQERMLCVVEPANVEAVLELCEKWEVGGAAIGTVTDTGHMRVFDGGELVGEMPVRALVDDCPLYDLVPVKSTRTYPAPKALIQKEGRPTEILRALLSSANIASRRPLFEQYDAIVQSRTVRRPEQADAAVLAIRPLGEGAGPVPGIAVSIDGNGRRVAADPYTGTVAAVLECASNLACVGARPLGTTNNLNFGNPEKGHIAWQLTEAVRGLGDACRALEAPIVGGNVSLYNESPPTHASAGPIYPTPVIGMVGELPDVRRAGQLGFARAGEAIALAGPFVPSLDASELAKLWGEELPDGLPPIDVEAVAAAQAAVREAVRAGTLSSAHDIAEGGLAVALAECCLAGNLGARVSLGTIFGAEQADATGRAGIWSGISAATAATPPCVGRLFGECSGAFVVSGGEAELRALGELTSVWVVGEVGGELLRVEVPAHGDDAGETVELTLAELADAHQVLGRLFA
ncbi:MAG TPA: phosphoribosylformylglycinamidine synthase subunit PurL [Solirubrobacteraceae bacterium]|jgi:phosphoribosylformylglycinamidine synthase II|nr:phosphoribosylformylglycinamidine synthase subunit PurL [Solirubrobacteraceae bacterium]